MFLLFRKSSTYWNPCQEVNIFQFQFNENFTMTVVVTDSNIYTKLLHSNDDKRHLIAQV